MTTPRRLVILSALTVCTMGTAQGAPGAESPTSAPAASAPATRPAAWPPGQFILGADVTMLTKVEHAGGVFSIFSTASVAGRRADPLAILKDSGFTHIRLRLFHTPSGKGPLCCDLAYILPLAQRAKRAGLRVMLDLHYSDTWADPAHQSKPAAWAAMNFEELKGAVFEYTRGVVEALALAGVRPDVIQLGNEVNMGMLHPDGKTTSPEQWERFAQLLKSARAGARAGLGPAAGSDERPVRFMHHLGEPKIVIWHMDNLLQHGFEPDLIGISYYPFWHGTLAELQAHLNRIAVKYGKDIVIAETAFPWTNRHFDADGDLFHVKLPDPNSPPATPEGQAEFYRRLLTLLRAVPAGHGAGMIPWEPTWLPSARFGSPMDNLTLFDEKGQALPALGAIRAAVAGVRERP
jgi:arabinogalactan endo-1,4-beta-galactosidase